jgi:hypothetical protein
MIFSKKCVRYRFWHKIYTLRFIINNNSNLAVIQIMANKILKQYKYNIYMFFFFYNLNWSIRLSNITLQWNKLNFNMKQINWMERGGWSFYCFLQLYKIIKAYKEI